MNAHHEHQLVAEDVLVGDTERSTESEVALRFAVRIVTKGEQVPSRSLHPVDDAVRASSDSPACVVAVSHVDGIVEEEVSVEELHALTNQRRSLVALNLHHADLVIQVIDVVKVRALITNHQVNRTRGLALTRSGEVCLTHLAATIDCERRDILVLVVPTCHGTCVARAVEAMHRISGRRRQLKDTVAGRSVGRKFSVAVQGSETADLIAVAGAKLTRDPLMEIGQSQFRIVLKDTSEVHLAVCFGQILTGNVERIDETRSNHVSSVCILRASTCDNLRSGIDLRHSTGTISHNSELTLRTLQRIARQAPVLHNLFHQGMEFYKHFAIGRHQLIKRRRQNVW